MPQREVSVPRPRGAAAGAAGKAAVSPPRVLVIDDDPSICSALSEVLREEGFEVASATNGRAALDLLRGGPPPSAILLDLMMPVMDGWDFRQVQLQDAGLRDIPVVVVTAAGFSPSTIHTQFGAVALIPKPVPLNELLNVLGRTSGPPPAS
jgi:CheY-like chemotaxis protein